MRTARVKSLSLHSDVVVQITSKDKPEVMDETIKKWQQILDLAANLVKVPSGLITRITEKQLEVLLTSRTENNIFEASNTFDLGIGWYCESVAAQKKEMLIENAYKLDAWKDNPSLPFNMMSYMGFPIFWPDGEIFGTFCMLDNKEHLYEEQYKELLHSLREIIQQDLKSVLMYQKVQKELKDKDYQIREVHHRVKNHFNLLINTISMQSLFNSRDNPKELLSEIQSRIFAISSIHDKLYHSLDIEKISLGDYLCGLGNQIVKSVAQINVDFSCRCEPITGETDIYLSCGLLLNELITNSLKYAFDGNNEPRINFTLKLINGFIVFEYRDNGCGLDCKENDDNTDSLGVLLIQQMVLRLKGEYRMYNDSGFVFEMKFSPD